MDGDSGQESPSSPARDGDPRRGPGRPRVRVFLEGRYRKLVRDLPQTIFYCPRCKGRRGGCPACDGYGKLTKDSVQELIKRCREEQASSNLVDEPAPPVEETPPPEEQKPPPPPPPPPSKGLHPIYFWSAVGVGGAMLLMGTVTGGLALNKSSKYKDPATSASEAAYLKDQGGDLKTASTVTFIVGATAVAGAAVLYFFTDFQRKELGSGPAAQSPSVAAAPLARKPAPIHSRRWSLVGLSAAITTTRRQRPARIQSSASAKAWVVLAQAELTWVFGPRAPMVSANCACAMGRTRNRKRRSKS